MGSGRTASRPVRGHGVGPPRGASAGAVAPGGAPTCQGAPSAAAPRASRSHTQRVSTSAKPPRPRGRAQCPIAGNPGVWQRANVSGRIKRPKLASDEAKLKALFAHCRDGNLRETRALVAHFPYLLALTDAYGFSAMHHAEMSGSPAFLEQVLELYRDPKTFALKVLVYTSEEEMLEDRRLGLELSTCTRPLTSDRWDGLPKVLSVGKGTRAEAAGVMVGDVLEAARGVSFLSKREAPPHEKDAIEAFCIGSSDCLGFPLALEFRGAACVEILCRDGWTPSHGAAGKAGGKGDRQILDQLLSEQSRADTVEDARGCTPMHWSKMEAKATGARRRPLSAGPRGVVLARGLRGTRHCASG